jgi:hypothetical protein
MRVTKLLEKYRNNFKNLKEVSDRLIKSLTGFLLDYPDVRDLKHTETAIFCTLYGAKLMFRTMHNFKLGYFQVSYEESSDKGAKHITVQNIMFSTSNDFIFGKKPEQIDEMLDQLIATTISEAIKKGMQFPIYYSEKQEVYEVNKD